MQSRKHISTVVMCLVVLAQAGCYSYVPVDVYVVDRATTRPIKGATVVVVYRFDFNPFPPSGEEVESGEDGVAHLHVTNSETHTYVIRASGYQRAEFEVFRNTTDNGEDPNSTERIIMVVRLTPATDEALKGSGGLTGDQDP